MEIPIREGMKGESWGGGKNWNGQGGCGDSWACPTPSFLFLFLSYSFPFQMVASLFPTFVPSFLTELKSILIPVPVYCEGTHCACSSCKNPILLTDYPMDYYEVPKYCSEECLEEYIEAELESSYSHISSEEEEYESAYSDYIDSVLDCDYDW